MENEKELIAKWESLTFTNNFIFWKILTTNPDVCKKLIEILLGREIERIEIPESEKTLETNPKSHGIRLDVFVKNETESFDLEIQVVDKNDLPQRARYYQGVLDVDNLRIGRPYTELKTSYILFLCLFDPFDKGYPVYSFENICQEDNCVKLNDRSYKIFYNAKSCAKIIGNSELNNFLDFLNKGEAKDSFTEKLNSLVERTKQDCDWRHHFMTIEVMKTYAHMEGVEEGFREGVKEGHEKGIKEGLEQGRSEGLEQGARENAEKTALNLLEMKILSVEQVMHVTGLPLDRIQELASGI